MAKSRAPQKAKTRAARRAASPPPADLEAIPRLATTSSPKPLHAKVLGPQGGQGIVKKKTRGPVRGKSSTKQKKRAEAAIDKAQVATERLARKTEESKKRGKVVEGRKGNWEELNAKAEAEAAAAAKAAEELAMKV